MMSVVAGEEEIQGIVESVELAGEEISYKALNYKAYLIRAVHV